MNRNLIISTILIITLLLTACEPFEQSTSKPITNDSVNLGENQDYYLDIMETSYYEFERIKTKMGTSAGSGEDVRDAYYRSQEIVTMLRNMNVPSNLSNMKNNLVNGINKQSTGFGCFSNNSLCGGDTEAVLLLAQGKSLLDDFLQESQTF